MYFEQGHAMFWRLFTNNIQLFMPKKIIKPGNHVSALLTAAKNGKLQEIKDQYAPSIDLEAKDEAGCTALDIAAYHGFLGIVQFLLKKGAQSNTKTHQGSTPLHGAAVNGHLEIVELLLEQENIEIDAINRNGNTPLHKAAYAGHYEVVQYLLDKGADPNRYDENNNPPLLYAILKGQLNIVALLIAKGADLNVTAYEGKSLREYATQARDGMVADFIEAVMVNDSIEHNNITAIVLYYAVQSGCIEVVEYLLREDPDLIHIQDRQNRTLLSVAIETGYYNVVTLLLSFDPITQWNPTECNQWMQNAIESLYSLYPESPDSEIGSDVSVNDESERDIALDAMSNSASRDLDDEVHSDQLTHDADYDVQIASETESESDVESDSLSAQLESDAEESLAGEFNYYEEARKIKDNMRTSHIQLIALLFVKGYDTYTLDVERYPILEDIDESDRNTMQDFLNQLKRYDTVKKGVTHRFFGPEKQDSMLSKVEQDSIAVWLNLAFKVKTGFYRLICHHVWNQLPIDLLLTVVEQSLYDEIKTLPRFSLDGYRTSQENQIVKDLTKNLVKQLSLFYYQKHNDASQLTQQSKLTQ